MGMTTEKQEGVVDEKITRNARNAATEFTATVIERGVLWMKLWWMFFVESRLNLGIKTRRDESLG
jgi:hypothetical protein